MRGAGPRQAKAGPRPKASLRPKAGLRQAEAGPRLWPMSWVAVK